MTSSTTLPAHLDVYILSLTRIGLDDSTLNSVIANVPRSGVLWSRRAVAHRQQARHRRADPGGQRFDRHRIADHAQRAAQRTLPSSALGRRRDASSCCDERLQRARPCAERGQARQRRSAVHTRPCPRSRPARPSFRPREYCYATPYARPDRPTSRPDRQLDTVLAQHCIPNHPTLLRTDSALQV